jgi:hypothetical protein
MIEEVKPPEISIAGVIGGLMTKEGPHNPTLMAALTFTSDILVLAASQTSSEEGKKLVRVAARLALDLEWKLRPSIDASPSEFDNKILDEFIEACKEIEPGYVAVC